MVASDVGLGTNPARISRFQVGSAVLIGLLSVFSLSLKALFNFHALYML